MIAPHEVAVVTIAAGRHEHLRGLAGLARSSQPPGRHVVVSMGDDAVAGVVAEHPAPWPQPVVHVPVPDDGELPLARARNAGVERALADGARLLVLLDVDCVPSRGLLARYAAATAQVPDDAHPAVLAGAVHYLPERGPEGYPAEGLERLAPPHPARPVPPDGEVVVDRETRLFWSLSFAMTGEDWVRTGGFCEDYTGYGGEDTDFGRLVARAGGAMVWVGGAAAAHQHHPTRLTARASPGGGGAERQPVPRALGLVPDGGLALGVRGRRADPARRAHRRLGPGRQPAVERDVVVDHAVARQVQAGVLVHGGAVEADGARRSAAIAAVSPPATSAPVGSRPGAPSGLPSTSGSPPRAKATTGVPQASASAATSPDGSSQSGVTSTAAEAPTSAASAVPVRWPTYSTSGPSSGRTTWRNHARSLIGPASRRRCPARRAASIASLGAFSGTIRPDHSRASPPGPGRQVPRSTPFATTVARRPTCAHCCAVCRLTAENAVVPSPAACAASSHGVGGVCSVVSSGVRSVPAMAIGR
ncbi:hypothetical protein GCM10025868_31770 [Angustibacter aerolatus]|uniref:Galactosyltransferase C-terminal domain-containing protein n=1 Tax=Angustibacter aerolatus TaxID=1162965 RepID=A0ABQ6JI77_9ACTN|nr:galactosyltransferase-related protein [Angustibacter aerolatus]GMA87927.1 hypothetical protein GCM10025868_31770 [Angustibacter aerolatus]